jgi:hypothetical protein
MRLCWRAHELDGVDRQVALKAALESRAGEGMTTESTPGTMPHAGGTRNGRGVH